METQLKYKELRQQSQQDAEEQTLQFEVEEVQQQLQADVLNTKRSLASKKKEYAVAIKAYPFNTQRIIDLQIEIEGLENGLVRVEKLLSDLF